jgi:toxin ParE1/3/4
MSTEPQSELRFLAPGVLATPAAQNDVIQIAVYLGGKNPQLVPRFYEALSQTLKNLSAMPHLGAPRSFSHRRLQGVRQWPVRDFKNYLIFYRPFASNDGLTVLRVLHTARDVAVHLEEAVEQE